jgi:hypothetical protein
MLLTAEQERACLRGDWNATLVIAFCLELASGDTLGDKVQTLLRAALSIILCGCWPVLASEEEFCQ